MTRADVLIKSYVEMLRLPVDDHWRMVNGEVYAKLRDIIAKDLKVEPETVQKVCEAMARS